MCEAQDTLRFRGQGEEEEKGTRAEKDWPGRKEGSQDMLLLCLFCLIKTLFFILSHFNVFLTYLCYVSLDYNKSIALKIPQGVHFISKAKIQSGPWIINLSLSRLENSSTSKFSQKTIVLCMVICYCLLSIDFVSSTRLVPLCDFYQFNP